jgi:hypothetical protein
VRSDLLQLSCHVAVCQVTLGQQLGVSEPCLAGTYLVKPCCDSRCPLTAGSFCSWFRLVLECRLQIAEAASGLCELLWLVDESVPEDASTSRLLRKVGKVVNIAGLSPEETVSVLRAHSPDGWPATATRTLSLCRS